ncbi:MAG: DUF4012 domain-containing protein [Microbacterium sp.]
MTTRREAREARAAAEGDSAASDDPFDFDTFGAESDDSGRRTRKPLLKSARFWVPISILLVLIALAAGIAVAGKALADDAFAAKDDLEKAMPLVATVQQSMLAGDTDTAKSASAQLAELTASAKNHTDTPLWRNVEWVPVAGPNLKGVRIAAASADALVRDAVMPLTDLSVEAIVPTGGAVDLARLQDLAQKVDRAATSIHAVQKEMATIDRDALIGPVAGGVDKINAALDKIAPIIDPAQTALTLLPKALGADGPRHYLLIFQNNAESRGTGGNPAAIAYLTAENGKISLTGQAGSGDFQNGRETPVIDLDPQTKALYGDKIGRYVMDSTLSPDFTETSKIVQAFWAETYGTAVDGVASFDPVALGYLLNATGPVDVGDGLQLTSQNVVKLLLSDVYSLFPDPADQDDFFAGTAGLVFQALIDRHPDPKALLTELGRAADEGRLMFAPNDPDEAKVIAGTKVSGTLPATDAEQTVTGVYVNDITEGKLDYYMQLDIAASSTQCQASSAKDAATFSTTAKLTNTLTPGEVEGLAPYVAPGRFFAKGEVSTDLVIYGPVGAAVTSVTVNGTAVTPQVFPHLGRNAVKVNVRTSPGQTVTVEATFTGAGGPYGPLEVRHTPMVKETPVTIDTPGCVAKP